MLDHYVPAAMTVGPMSDREPSLAYGYVRSNPASRNPIGSAPAHIRAGTHIWDEECSLWRVNVPNDVPLFDRACLVVLPPSRRTGASDCEINPRRTTQPLGSYRLRSAARPQPGE